MRWRRCRTSRRRKRPNRRRPSAKSPRRRDRQRRRSMNRNPERNRKHSRKPHPRRSRRSGPSTSPSRSRSRSRSPDRNPSRSRSLSASTTTPPWRRSWPHSAVTSLRRPARKRASRGTSIRRRSRRRTARPRRRRESRPRRCPAAMQCRPTISATRTSGARCSPNSSWMRPPSGSGWSQRPTTRTAVRPRGRRRTRRQWTRRRWTRRRRTRRLTNSPSQRSRRSRCPKRWERRKVWKRQPRNHAQGKPSRTLQRTRTTIDPLQRTRTTIDPLSRRTGTTSRRRQPCSTRSSRAASSRRSSVPTATPRQPLPRRATGRVARSRSRPPRLRLPGEQAEEDGDEEIIDQTLLPRRRGRSRTVLWSAAAALLVAALGAQVIHGQRAQLATHPEFGPRLQQIYGLFGADVQPRWDIGALCVESSSGDASANSLQITSVIVHQGDRPQPYPLLHVSLTDRWQSVIGSRSVEADDYLPDGELRDVRMHPGDRVRARARLSDPGSEAAGYELHVCYRSAEGDLRCSGACR